MKLIRWLLSNIILIVLVLALSYAYVYWDNLTGEDTPAGKTFAWLSDEFEAVEGLLDYLKVSGTPRVETSDSQVGEQMAAAPSDVTTATSPPPADQNAALQASTKDRYVTPEIEASLSRLNSDGSQREVPAVAQTNAGGVSAPNLPAAEQASQRPDSGFSARSPAMEQARLSMNSNDFMAGDSADNQAASAGGGAVTDSDTTPAQSTRELWISARRSFHRRDFSNSIKSYEQLISSTPDNFDAYGELGNVYFNQGNMKQAVSSYYEAAAILVRLGQVSRASSLMGMLGHMDPAKARELQELIASTGS